MPRAGVLALNTQQIVSSAPLIQELGSVFLNLSDPGFISVSGSCIQSCDMDVRLRLRHDSSMTEVDLWRGTVHAGTRLGEIRFSATSHNPPNSPMALGDMQPAGDFSTLRGLSASGTMSLLFQWTPTCSICQVDYGGLFCLAAIGTSTTEVQGPGNLSLLGEGARIEFSQSVQHPPGTEPLPLVAGKPVHLRVLVEKEGDVPPFTVVLRLIPSSGPNPPPILPYDVLLKSPDSPDWDSFLNTFNFAFDLDASQALGLADIQLEVNPEAAPYPLDGSVAEYEAYSRQPEETYSDNVLSLASIGSMPVFVTGESPRIGYVFLSNYGQDPSGPQKQLVATSGDEVYRRLFPVSDRRHVNAFWDAVLPAPFGINPQDVANGDFTLRRWPFIEWMSRLREKKGLDFLYGYYVFDLSVGGTYLGESWGKESVGIGPVEDFDLESVTFAHEVGHWAGARAARFLATPPFDRSGHLPCSPDCPTPLGVDVYHRVPVQPSSDNALMKDIGGTSMTLAEADFFYRSSRFALAPVVRDRAVVPTLAVHGSLVPGLPQFSDMHVYEGSGTPSIAVENARFRVEAYSENVLVGAYGIEPDSGAERPNDESTSPVSAGPRIGPSYFSVILEAAPGGHDVDRLVLRDVEENRILAQSSRSGNDPRIESLSLSIVGDGLRLDWEASDPDGDPLRFDVDYSNDGGSSFQPLDVNLEGGEFLVDLDRLPGTRGFADGVLRLVAHDGFNSSSQTAPGVVVPGKPPVVFIDQPDFNQSYLFGATVFLSCIARDLEDGDLGSSVAWTSSLDGMLGTGASVGAILSPGVHLITASAGDSDDMEAADVVVVEVALPAGPTARAPVPSSRRTPAPPGPR